jgi:hypothetical protein
LGARKGYWGKGRGEVLKLAFLAYIDSLVLRHSNLLYQSLHAWETDH